jgi:hypothetical protein
MEWEIVAQGFDHDSKSEIEVLKKFRCTVFHIKTKHTNEEIELKIENTAFKDPDSAFQFEVKKRNSNSEEIIKFSIPHSLARHLIKRLKAKPFVPRV